MTWTYAATLYRPREGEYWLPAAFWNGDPRWCVTQQYDERGLVAKKWAVLWAPIGKPICALPMKLKEAQDTVKRLVDGDCDYVADDRISAVRIQTRMPPPIINQMNPERLKSGYGAALALLGNIGKAVRMAWERVIVRPVETLIGVGKLRMEYVKRWEKQAWNLSEAFHKIGVDHAWRTTYFCLGRIGQNIAAIMEDDNIARAMLLEIEMPKNATAGASYATPPADKDQQQMLDRFDLLEMN